MFIVQLFCVSQIDTTDKIVYKIVCRKEEVQKEEMGDEQSCMLARVDSAVSWNGLGLVLPRIVSSRDLAMVFHILGGRWAAFPEAICGSRDILRGEFGPAFLAG